MQNKKNVLYSFADNQTKGGLFMSLELQKRQEALVNAAAGKDPAKAIKEMQQIIKNYDTWVQGPYYHESLKLDFIAQASNKKGESILHVANSPKIIEFAVEECPELLYRIDNKGYTAVMTAALHGKEDILKTLLELNKKNGIDNIDFPNYTDGKSALHLVLNNPKISESAKERIVKMLLEYGADPSTKDSNGKQALAYTKNPKIKNILASASKKGATASTHNMAQTGERQGLSTLQQFPTVAKGDASLNKTPRGKEY